MDHIITTRLNDKEYTDFINKQKESGLKQSTYIKTRLFSKNLTEKEVAQSRALVQQAYAAVLLELSRDGRSLSQHTMDQLGFAVGNYVHNKTC